MRGAPNQKKAKPGQVPLERALSKLGIASRTQAREWILQGRVKVNGALRREPLYPVNPEKARLEIDGKLQDPKRPRAYLLHKPRGTVTTRSDEKGRPTVFSLLEGHVDCAGLHAVGRLDWATSGLLILTNDTRLSSWLTDPDNEVLRVYLVSVRGEVRPEALARLEAGIFDSPGDGQGERLQADRAILRKASGRESHLTIELRQGRNREIRRMLAALGHEVTKLKRVAYGGLELGELEPGRFRELAGEELERAFPGARRRGSGSPD
jgi:23S rRNA pseudouridine2605 synthase